MILSVGTLLFFAAGTATLWIWRRCTEAMTDRQWLFVGACMFYGTTLGLLVADDFTTHRMDENACRVYVSGRTLYDPRDPDPIGLRLYNSSRWNSEDYTGGRGEFVILCGEARGQ